MGEKSTAFAKGGCGCLALFSALAVLALMTGGHVQIDAGGAIFLFVFGGGVGLLVLWIYNMGKREGESPGPPPEQDDQG